MWLSLIKLYLRKWRAECVRDNVDFRSKEGSRRLAVAKGLAGYYGNLVSWQRVEKNFRRSKEESSREYTIDNVNDYIHIPKKYKSVRW